MAATVENSPARQRIAGQLTAALWGAVAVVAVIGLTGSITEMINTGGQVHGLIAWPGAASVNLTVLVLIASAATLMLMTGVGVMRWRRAKGAI